MGEALGPSLQPDYNVMDMGQIFMGSSTCYQVRTRQPEQLFVELNVSLVQVQLANKGLIDAPFRLSWPASRFGGCFRVSPDGGEGVVPSGRIHTLQVSFSSPACGSFSEQLLLAVEGNPEVAAVTFR